MVNRREYFKLSGIPETIENKGLEGTVVGIFEKLDMILEPSNVEDCHWIKSSKGSKRVIVKLSRRKYANKIRLLKQNYYSRMASKLTNVQRNSKTYWSLLNRFLNNKKIPLIPPLFHENKFVTDFKEKAELFNAFFAKQCSLIKNSSKLPSHLHYLTDNRLSSVSFSQDDIAKIIQNLDPNKAHGHDNISIRMLKICGSSIYKPLEMIFK